jgi:hypothetical protein
VAEASAETPDLRESPWLPALAVVTAALLYATLPSKYISGSGASLTVARWLIPALSIVLLAPVVLTRPLPHTPAALLRRSTAILLMALITIANTAAIVLLVHYIVNGHKVNGHELIRAAIHIWCTNVLVFGLWFWQLDGGGPAARRRGTGPRDFAFPQMTDPEVAAPGWHPLFVDYLYVSFTNSSAFSPTDTMPLTRWAKVLMLVQSSISIVTLILVAARAVNILR